MIKLRKDITLPMLIDVAGQLFRFFCFVLTTLVLISGVLARFAGSEWVLYTLDLQRFLLVSLFSVLPMLNNLFFIHGTIRGVYVLRIVQFVLTTVLVMGALILFREAGAGIDTRTIIAYSIIFLVIYASVLIKFLRENRLATKINKELDVLRRGENETRPM